MIRIKRGEVQPIDCINCEGKMGYQVTDTIQIGYTFLYHANGKEDGGLYTDSQREINTGKLAFCWNCGEKLGFRITE